MNEEKRFAKVLTHAYLNGDKATADQTHTAMRDQIRAKAGQMAQARMNDNA